MKRVLIIGGLVLAAMFIARGAQATGIGQGPCHHGNSNQTCRPDPQPSHGQDCDPHGNGGGENQDHCAGTPTPTPSASPSVSPSESPSVTPSVTPTPSPSPSVNPDCENLRHEAPDCPGSVTYPTPTPSRILPTPINVEKFPRVVVDETPAPAVRALAKTGGTVLAFVYLGLALLIAGLVLLGGSKK